MSNKNNRPEDIEIKLHTVSEMAEHRTKDREIDELREMLKIVMTENDLLKTALADITSFAVFNGDSYEVRIPYFQEGTQALGKTGINSRVESKRLD